MQRGLPSAGGQGAAAVPCVDPWPMTRHCLLSTHFRKQFPSMAATPSCPVTDQKPDSHCFLVGYVLDGILQRESLNIKNTLLLSYLVLFTILFGLRHSTSSCRLYRVIKISAVCTVQRAAVRYKIRKCCSVALHMYCFVKRKVEDCFKLCDL